MSTQASGDCFRVAWRIMLDIANSDWVVVHAYVKGQKGLAGKRFWHAWVEFNDFVMDKSNGNNILMPRSKYYRLAGITNAKYPEIVKYSKLEALKLSVKHGHYGPWHKESETMVTEEVVKVRKNKWEIKKKGDNVGTIIKLRNGKYALKREGGGVVGIFKTIEAAKKSKKLKEEAMPPDIKEEAIVNSAGGGAIAGIGVGPNGEPGRNSSKIIRRKKVAGVECFEVAPDYYYKCRMGKRKFLRYDKYVGNDEVGEAIRQYARSNPTEPVMVQNELTGGIMYLRYGNGKKD